MDGRSRGARATRGRARPSGPVVLALLAILAAGLATGPAMARDLHVAARGTVADAEPDGSVASPFPSVEAALPALAAGDRLLLADGTHGPVRILGHRFAEVVTIEPAEGATARTPAIRVADSAGIRLRGLGVWPDTPAIDWRALVIVEPSAEDITLEALDIRSGPDAEAYLDWSAETWRGRYRDGVRLDGTRIALRDSRLLGLRHGVAVTGPHAEVTGNLIEGFSGDGLLGIGDHGVYRGNTVQNCVKVDGNHDDGFQSWSLGPNRSVGTGVVTGVVIDANRFLEWVGPRDHPLRCVMQGIGLFDGRYADWVIQNNLIAVRAFHGITMGGADNPRVLHNTVVHADGARQKKPWIKITGHKDGSPSRGGIVANNIAAQVVLETKRNPTIVGSKNLPLRRPSRVFQDPFRGDFRLKPTAGSIDAGDPRFATERDIDGTPRPKGGGPDLGAFEIR